MSPSTILGITEYSISCCLSFSFYAVLDPDQTEQFFAGCKYKVHQAAIFVVAYNLKKEQLAASFLMLLGNHQIIVSRTAI